MAELKTKPTTASPAAFIAAISDPAARRDAKALAAILRKVTGKRAEMWGTRMVGFGRCRYRYQSGRTGEWFLAGFSPRKQAFSLHCMGGVANYPELLGRLGKYRAGVGCVYFKTLADLHQPTLIKLITRSVKDAVARWPSRTG